MNTHVRAAHARHERRLARPPEPIVVSVRLVYDGVERLVDNISALRHGQRSVLCGMEVMRGGERSQRVKRYALDRIERIEFIDPRITAELRDEGRP